MDRQGSREARTRGVVPIRAAGGGGGEGDRGAGRGYALEMEAHSLEKARELGVDLTATLEDALALEVHKRQRETWLEENREAIEAYNELVVQHGVFSTGLRGF